ncbi:MAG TPA: TonB-dependent receptor [Pelagibacterium sp.]|uniref:TonB-dependent receptor n=1 Tax=Pelagibacterium sp. TaxID=1967288 RepID=UPI002C940DA5|nr:TonB-dependent receptor [Pelagibacterium sp.]HWJ86806.1 TonB-dependent receptor [Pelagibacterium sp.]
MKKSFYISLTTGAGLVALAIASPGSAQDRRGVDSDDGAQPYNPQDDIIVTATRREESIREVPQSIAAYSQEQMDKQGVRDVGDIARLTPGISFSRTNGLGSMISMRGISSGAGSATVGVYIDDTPIAQRATIASGNFSSNAYPQIFDLERVEVLRGPQGTLFGASSEGGAIRFITPTPSLTQMSVYGRGELGWTEGGANSYEAGVAVGGPLVVDKVGFRASVWHRTDGGFVDRLDSRSGRVDDENANEQRTLAARFALRFQPTERLSITPSVFYQRINLDDMQAIWLPNNDPRYQHLNYTDQSQNKYGHAYPLRQPFNQNFVLPALKLEYEADGFDIISNTSYYRRKEAGVTDFTPFEVPMWTTIFTGVTVPLPDNVNDVAPGFDNQKNNFFTQEVRIQNNNPDARLNWTIGGFYSKNKVSTFRSVENKFLGQLLLDTGMMPCATPDACVEMAFGVPLVDGRFLFVGDTTTWDTQLAGFGQVDLRLTDKLTLTGGIRVSKTKFKFENLADGPVNGPPAPRLDIGSSNETPVTGMVSVSYKADNGNLYYASVSDGFRIGGANVPIYNQGCDVDAVGGVPTTYDSDRVRNYEAGAKLSFANNAIQFDGSVFLIKWKNRIGNVAIPPVGACPLSFTDNLGDVTSYGFDMLVRVRPAAGLTLTAAVGDANATYDEDFFSTNTQTKPTVSKGDAISGSRTTFTLSADYAFQLNASTDLYMRGDYTYTGRNDRGSGLNPNNAVYDPTASNDPGPTNNVVNARIGARVSGLDISAFVNNLFDENYLMDGDALGFGSPLHGAYLYNRPRSYGVTVAYRY